MRYDFSYSHIYSLSSNHRLHDSSGDSARPSLCDHVRHVLTHSFVLPIHVLEPLDFSKLKRLRRSSPSSCVFWARATVNVTFYEPVDTVRTDHKSTPPPQDSLRYRYISVIPAESPPHDLSVSGRIREHNLRRSYDIRVLDSQVTEVHFCPNTCTGIVDDPSLSPGLAELFSVPRLLQCTNDFRVSPFPLLDRFVSSQCSRGGVQGLLKSWAMVVRQRQRPADPQGPTWTATTREGPDRSIASTACADSPKHSSLTPMDYRLFPPAPPAHPYSAVITYQVTNNRFCQNIGRMHCSNHIMLEVDLYKGLLFQRCWDPDCRGYRSPAEFVPSACLPSELNLDEWLQRNGFFRCGPSTPNS